jgi:hypothetical protein
MYTYFENLRIQIRNLRHAPMHFGEDPDKIMYGKNTDFKKDTLFELLIPSVNQYSYIYPANRDGLHPEHETCEYLSGVGLSSLTKPFKWLTQSNKYQLEYFSDSDEEAELYGGKSRKPKRAATKPRKTRPFAMPKNKKRASKRFHAKKST